MEQTPKSLPIQEVKPITGHFYAEEGLFTGEEYHNRVFSAKAIEAIQSHDCRCVEAHADLSDLCNPVYSYSLTGSHIHINLVDVGNDVFAIPRHPSSFYYARDELSLDPYRAYTVANADYIGHVHRLLAQDIPLAIALEDACPNCGDVMGREEADVGVGIIYGPYGCGCGYSTDSDYNMLTGKGGLQEDGSYVDTRGGVYTKDSQVAKAMKLFAQGE